MPEALTKTDITTVSIGTTRGSVANAWEFDLKTTDDVVSFGTIYDNANTFVDGTTSASKALMIVIAGDAETVSINDMDTIVVDGLTIWLPSLSGDDTLYVDTDGNTWYDESLTIPAGGVSAVSDSFTLAESDFDGTDYFSDSVTLSETFSVEDTGYLNDTISVGDGISDSLESFTIYLEDSVKISSLAGIKPPIVPVVYGDFTEDTQINTTWTEI